MLPVRCICPRTSVFSDQDYLALVFSAFGLNGWVPALSL